MKQFFAWVSPGSSLMEMVVVLAILSLLATLATPFARMSIKREKEMELRETLRTMRIAIDRFHADMEGVVNKKENKYASENGYPLSLRVLIDGIEVPVATPPARTALGGDAPGSMRPAGTALGGEAFASTRLAGTTLGGDALAGARTTGDKKKKRYLRALPKNPFAPPRTPLEAQWTFVSYLHERPLIASSSYGRTLAEARETQSDIYDLHAVTSETALDGTRYADW